MINFQFTEDDKIIITPELCLVEEFVDTIKWDPTPNNEKASKIFKYVDFLCNMSSGNTYRDLPEDIKESSVMRAVYGDKKLKFTKREGELVQRCIDAYLTVNSLPEERVLETFDVKADEVRRVLEETLPVTLVNENNGVVEYTTNTDIITKGLKELNKTKIAKLAVMKVIRQEIGKDKVRGDAELSPLSLGRFKIPHINELLMI